MVFSAFYSTHKREAFKVRESAWLSFLSKLFRGKQTGRHSTLSHVSKIPLKNLLLLCIKRHQRNGIFEHQPAIAKPFSNPPPPAPFILRFWVSSPPKSHFLKAFRALWRHKHYVWFSRFYWHFCKIHHFCHFVPQQRHPELALKTFILVPKVAYDLPEFKIRP